MSNTTVEYLLRLRDQFSTGIRTATNDTERLNDSVNKTQNSLVSLKSAFAAIGAGIVAREVLTATASVETLRNQLKFASGSAEQGAKDFQYITDISKQMGLDLQVAGKAFAQFETAARGTTLAGKGVRDVFESVAMASTAMGLSSEQSEGAFLALQQMLSKGKIQAEELRGQLGERIPGAFQIAARAMGMTTSELDKFMADGKLMAEDFLPKFASQMKLEFSGAMGDATNSLNANLNRLNTTFYELKYTLGELFMPVIQGTITLLGSLAEMGKSVINVMNENKRVFALLGGILGTLAASLLLYRGYLVITTAAQWALNTATAFFEGLTGVGLFAVAAAGAAALAVGVYAAANAQDDLNASMKQTQGLAAKAVNPMTAKLPATPAASSTKSSTKSGTSTTAVESKGVQNFNINIQKLVEQISLQTTNITESATEIKQAVAQALIEAVNDFQLMATK